MAESICIILKRPPYGTVDAAEAVRHALGGVVEEMKKVSLLLLDSGALAAVSGQDAGDTGFLSIESSVQDCVDMGAEVYVDKASLREVHLEEADLVEGVQVINSSEVSEIVKDADKVMIF